MFTESVAKWAAVEKLRREPVFPPAYTVHLGSRKLARYGTEDGHRYELYDLAADPKETKDLYPEDSASAADLVALLETYERR